MPNQKPNSVFMLREASWLPIGQFNSYTMWEYQRFNFRKWECFRLLNHTDVFLIVGCLSYAWGSWCIVEFVRIIHYLWTFRVIDCFNAKIEDFILFSEISWTFVRKLNSKLWDWIQQHIIVKLLCFSWKEWR
jgi:hypothetical protein